MTYVHIDPNLPEITRSDEELRAAKQKDAISAIEHRDADFVAQRSASQRRGRDRCWPASCTSFASTAE